MFEVTLRWSQSSRFICYFITTLQQCLSASFCWVLVLLMAHCIACWTKPNYANNRVSTLTSIRNGSETMRNHSWMHSIFFGGVYISHHFPSDFHSSWDFLPAAVACRAGQIHTERRAPFVGHPSDLSGLSWVILDQLGHKWTSIQANINLSLVFFWYSIHRHGVLIREITTEMSGSYGISICISEVPGCDIWCINFAVRKL